MREADRYEWSSYVDSLPNSSRQRCDIYRQCLDLNSDATRLFSGKKGIEVWKRENGVAVKSDFKPEILNAPGDVVYVLHQDKSWSSLNTDLPDFRRILTAHHITPNFLEAIVSFGSKVTGDDDPYFEYCESEQPSDQNHYFRECSYLLRTYEKHGRSNLKDPWSLRQMAVFHRYEPRTSRSIWILIQPFSQPKAAFLKAFSETPESKCPHGLHQIFITMTMPNWRWYLNHRRRMISHYMEKAVGSSDVQKGPDYDTGFSDCQRLHKLIVSLSLAQKILRAVHETCLMLESQDMSSDLMTGNLRRVRGFIRTATTLERSAEGTSQLLSKLLEYRKSDQLNTQATMLANLTREMNVQSAELRHLAYESRNDARYTKILGFVATLYLPASLIASVFSSDLIQLPQFDLRDSQILYVSHAMWVFALVSISLTGITLVGTFWWIRRKEKQI